MSDDDLWIRIAAALTSVDQLRVCKLSDADVRFMTDAVIAELRPERCCEICGRTGTQKFTATRTGWVCRSIHACNRRAGR